MRHVILWSLFALSTVMGIILAGCSTQPATRSGKMVVVASIAPLADFSRQVGGGLVEVELLVPPGASSHTYQIEPSQMESLSRAKVLVLNGIGLEYWADKAIEAAGNPDLLVVETAKGLPVIDAGDDPDHPGGNPHVWLDPIDAIHQVEAIGDTFAKADPAHRKQYKANTSAYVRRLRQLDKEIRAEVSRFRSRGFIAFHPAWVYFARRYGLVQEAVIERSPGKEPSPAEVMEVVDTARRLKARAIFAEPQFSPKAAEAVASETGARVLYLDPQGKPPDYRYLETMRNNVSQMAKALR